MAEQQDTDNRIASALARIKAVLDAKAWTTDPAQMAPHLVEWRGEFRGQAAMVVRPGSSAEVAAIVTICAEAGIAMVPQGGNTGMCAGAVPDPSGQAIVLSLARMSRVREIDTANNTMTVEAGCILQALQAAAAEVDRYFPLSLAAEGSCMIGGNLSTNAGGTNVLRYGNARELVLGLEVVLPDGRIWDGLRGLRKDNTGYDLKQLFLGAEGTLGVITAAVLKLFPRPRDLRVAFCAVPDVAAAVALLNRAKADSGDAVETFEIISRPTLDLVLKHIAGAQDPLAAPYDTYVLLELVSTIAEDDGLAARLEAILGPAMADELVLDAVLAQSEAQRQNLWALRENATESQKLEGASIKHDVAVPISQLPAFYAAAEAAVHKVDPTVRIAAFGHLGDGNIHYNLIQPEAGDRTEFLGRRAAFNRAVHDVVVGLGGSISAEHGIGKLKREELQHYKDALSLELMGRIKNALDPKGIMNPGKVL